MKKQITTVLLAIAFLSTNLFAITPQEQIDGMDRELHKQSAAQAQAAQAQAAQAQAAQEDKEDEEEEKNEASGEIDSMVDEANQSNSSKSASAKEKSTASQAKSSKTKEKRLSKEEKRQAAIAQKEKELQWEKLRNELDHYVADSYWITWKWESVGDVQMALAITRLGFIPVRIATAVFGASSLSDGLEDWITKIILKERGTKLFALSPSHKMESLYVRIQYNAFNLLRISTEDYFDLIKEYPEVEYLFDDLYTFFKWRSHLHGYYAEYAATTNKDLAKVYETYSEATDNNESFYSYLLKNADKKILAEYLQAPNDYRYNEYFLYKIFQRAVRRNSFLAWERLSRIAKQQMLQAIEKKAALLTTQTAEQEEISLQDYAFQAYNALEDGRKWNGYQRYAAWHNNALPLAMNPRLGAGIALRKEIEKKMKGKSKENIRKAFEEKRMDYLQSRETNPVDIQWKKLLATPVEGQNGSEQKEGQTTNPLSKYKRIPDEDGYIATPKSRPDPIADDFTLLDEIAEKLTKKALEL